MRLSTGAEAVTLAGAQAWSLVLMDCQMPVMDSYEATRRIRELSGAAGKVPIVALTASALPEDLERCPTAGMNDTLTKPVDVERLARVLAEQLQGAR